jgi:hypothetical protein
MSIVEGKKGLIFTVSARLEEANTSLPSLPSARSMPYLVIFIAGKQAYYTHNYSANCFTG